MKKTINKLGFRKMDEMEKNIALKSQRIALVYVIIALLIWKFIIITILIVGLIVALGSFILVLGIFS